MSDVIQNRERAFETKYQIDEEQRFRALARRDKLFGLWLAGELGRADADAYATEVVMSNFEKPGDDDMLDKVRADLKAAGKQIPDTILLGELSKFFAEAVQQIAAAGK